MNPGFVNTLCQEFLNWSLWWRGRGSVNHLKSYAMLSICASLWVKEPKLDSQRCLRLPRGSGDTILLTEGLALNSGKAFLLGAWVLLLFRQLISWISKLKYGENLSTFKRVESLPIYWSIPFEWRMSLSWHAFRIFHRSWMEASSWVMLIFVKFLMIERHILHICQSPWKREIKKNRERKNNA